MGNPKDCSLSLSWKTHNKRQNNSDQYLACNHHCGAQQHLRWRRGGCWINRDSLGRPAGLTTPNLCTSSTYNLFWSNAMLMTIIQLYVWQESWLEILLRSDEEGCNFLTNHTPLQRHPPLLLSFMWVDWEFPPTRFWFLGWESIKEYKMSNSVPPVDPHWDNRHNGCSHVEEGGKGSVVREQVSKLTFPVAVRWEVENLIMSNKHPVTQLHCWSKSIQK